MKHKVFVYGSLKKGFPLNQYLSRSKFIKNHTTEGRYEMRSIADAYPIIAVGMGGEGKHIKGEVYKVSMADLQRLDSIELSAGYFKKTIEEDMIVYVYPIVYGEMSSKIKTEKDTYEWVE